MGKKIVQNCIYALIGVTLLVCVWLIAYKPVGNELVVPSPWDCFVQMGVTLTDGAFWTAFGNTFLRVLAAFGISFVSAVVFAVLSYAFPVVGRILSPIISVFRSLPVLAVTLILWMLLGSENTPVAVAFLSLFPMLYAGTVSGLCAVDEELLVMSRVYKVPLKKRILHLYLPTAAPHVARESAAALSFSLKLVVSAEVLADTYKSIGELMQDAKSLLDMPSLFALVCITALVGLVLEAGAGVLVSYIERSVQ